MKTDKTQYVWEGKVRSPANRGVVYCLMLFRKEGQISLASKISRREERFSTFIVGLSLTLRQNR